MESRTSTQYSSVQVSATKLEEVSIRRPKFEEVYRAEFSHVWRFLYRLGCRGQMTDDLTHDVFLMAFRKFEQFDASRPARPWLFGIAYRVASDFRALARHQREVPDEEAKLTTLEDEGKSPQLQVESREAKELVTRALEMLTLEQRGTFVLHELEQRTIPEVAEILGIPVPTAYTRLRAARAKFTLAVEVLSNMEGSPV